MLQVRRMIGPSAVRNRVTGITPEEMTADDFMDEQEGLTFPESLAMFERLDTLGLDFIEPSASNQSSGKNILPSFPRIARSVEKQSYFREQAAEIASHIRTPLILVGGNRNVGLMEQILNRDNIPLFSLARPLFSDPGLINKWKQNPDYVPRCVACNKCWDETPHVCVLNKQVKPLIPGLKMK